MDVDSVSHLTIGGQSVIDKCLVRFPNIIELTLIENHIEKIDRFINNFNRIVPLSQLTHLIIKHQDLTISQLIEILDVSPNIESLTFNGVSHLIIHPLSVKDIDLTRLMSKKNKITEMIMTYQCTLEHILFFVDLCPRLQRLEIDIDETQLEPIVQFLLSNNVPDLFWLNLMNGSIQIEQIQTIIERNKLLHDYVVRKPLMSSYLWW